MSSFNIFRSVSGFFGLVTGGGEGQNPSPNLNPHNMSASVPTSSNDLQSKGNPSPDSSDEGMLSPYSNHDVILPSDFGRREDAAAVEENINSHASGLLGVFFEGILGTSASTDDNNDILDNTRSTTSISNADNDCSSIVNDTSSVGHAVANTVEVESSVQMADGNVNGTGIALAEELVQRSETKKAGVQKVNVDTEHSGTDPSSSSDTSSIYTIESATTVEPDEEQRVSVDEPEADTDITVELKGSVKGLSVEVTVCETVETGVVDTIPASKSFADVLVEWRAQREKEWAGWEIENAILMDSVNTGTFAWYEDEAKGVGIDVDESSQGFVSYQDQLAELKRELDAFRREEDTALNTVNASAALVDPVRVSKSFAEELVEWHAQCEKERKEWEIENRLCMASENMGASTSRDENEPARIDKAEAVQDAVSYRDELNGELGGLIAITKRADWGAKRNTFAPLDKLQSSSYTRTTTKYLQVTRDVAAISKTSTQIKGCEELTGYGQAATAAFTRPPPMKRGKGRMTAKTFNVH